MLLLCVSLSARAQQADTEREREAVRRAVETYLYAESLEEVKRFSSPRARIISVDASGGQMRETALSKPAGKRPRGGKSLRSPQRIVAIDVAGDGASVKVATEWKGEGAPAHGSPPRPPHFQYVSLLKLDGEWKIVSILMPPVAFSRSASK